MLGDSEGTVVSLEAVFWMSQGAGRGEGRRLGAGENEKWEQNKELEKKLLIGLIVKFCYFFIFPFPVLVPRFSGSVSGKLPTYPSLKLSLTLTFHLGQNDGLGEG